MVKHLPAMQETQVQSLGWEDPLEREKATHSSTLAWKIPWMEDPGRLPHGLKESDTTKRLHFLTRNYLKLLIEIIANSFFNVEVGVIKQSKISYIKMNVLLQSYRRVADL